MTDRESEHEKRPKALKNSESDDKLDNLDRNEKEIIRDHEVASAKLVHEIIRLRGIAELEKPFFALLWSAIGCGFVIGLSPFAQGILAVSLPDSSYKGVLVALGYSVGFIAVIAGRMQLFTENTLTAVLPLATTRNRRNLLRTLRMWGIVIAGNVVGTLGFALFNHFDFGGMPQVSAAVVAHSVEEMHILMPDAFQRGVPAGFMIAALVWAMPNLERQEILIITIITWLMALGNVAHSIVGCAEMWVAVLSGAIGIGEGLFGFLIPALLGNIVGGALLFALLAHAPVRAEIEGSEAKRTSEARPRGRISASAGRGRG
ncbi:formate/nitrite transporter family protein [Erythrobacter sp. LQ02-29]|uniref:formate/nitrite transporter family protein n=1 Tax=Erythrobacter sp. LQ02-29 TaxID=2920384 RepID=UPI001F4DA162|nr:formate/nitrite transporter family protein [Erythrobacter sp. LQ02-29]MCP9221588.1 formate/nitrite transporter family protein [Erythrobacter sp. LQ02-29]